MIDWKERLRVYLSRNRVPNKERIRVGNRLICIDDLEPMKADFDELKKKIFEEMSEDSK